MRTTFLVLLSCSVAFSAAQAQQVGRYQVAPIPPTQTDSANRALILDTQEGYLWEYWSGPDATGHSSEGITFLGKPMPGKSPGESVPIQRFKKP